jgi:hypothetical protein
MPRTVSLPHSRLTSYLRRGSVHDVKRHSVIYASTKMNKLKYFLISVIAVALVGCASKTITSGREFDVAKIGEIKKGATTSDELIGLLGQPLAKSAQSADGVVWNYTWKKGTATTNQGSDGPVVTSQGDKKTLDVLIQNGVVENYTYKESPFWNEQLK